MPGIYQGQPGVKPLDVSIQANQTGKGNLKIPFVALMQARATVDGQNPDPPKRWRDDSPELPTNNGFPWVQSGAGFSPSTQSSPCVPAGP